MKFTWLHWLVAGLLVVIVFLILSRPSKPDSKAIILARDSIRRIEQQDRIHSMQVKTLEIRLANTLVKSSVDSARFVKEITLKNQQLAKKRVRIDTVFKDNPVVQDYLQTADSVFAMMHTRIDSLEADKQFQAGLYSQMIYIKDKQLSNWEMVSSQKDIVIKDLEKQSRRKSRGNKLLKAGAVVLGVGGFFLGSQL